MKPTAAWGLALPVFQGLAAEPGFDDAKALGPDAPLHLAEVGLGWCAITVATDPAQVRIPLEALDQVLHVWNLFQLAEHQGPQIPFGVVLDWSSGAVSVQPYPEDGMDGS